MDLAFELRILDKPGSVIFVLWSDRILLLLLISAVLGTFCSWMNTYEMQLPTSWSKLCYADTKQGALGTRCFARVREAAHVPDADWFWQLWSFTNRAEAYRQDILTACCSWSSIARSFFSKDYISKVLWFLSVLILDKLCCNQMEFHRAKPIHLWRHTTPEHVALIYELMSSW